MMDADRPGEARVHRSHRPLACALAAAFALGCQAGSDPSARDDSPPDTLDAMSAPDTPHEAWPPDPGIPDPGPADARMPDADSELAMADALVDAPIPDAPDVPATLPRISGTYDVASTFRLASGLAHGYGLVLSALIELVADPGRRLLTWWCDPSTADWNPPERFCAYLFQDPDHPSTRELTPIGILVADLIDARHLGMLPDACMPWLPGPDTPTATLGSDFGAVLNRLEFRATMACGTGAGDAEAASGSACDATWHAVEARLAFCGACNLAAPATCNAALSLATLPGIEAPIRTAFAVQMTPGPALAIADHPMDLPVGALMAAVIDRLALPGLFGTGQDGLPAVDGLDRYLGALLGGRACLNDGTCCTVFAEDVVARANADDGLTRIGVEGSCDAMIQRIPEEFHDALRALDAPGTTFRLGTPAGEPCALADLDADGTVDRMGSPAAPCAWNAVLTVDGHPGQVPASFLGVRQ
jgi:hypothetical protein